MFYQVTWLQFFTALLLIFTIYYLFVFILFDFKGITGVLKRFSTREGNDAPYTIETQEIEANEDSPLTIIQDEFVSQLRFYLEPYRSKVIDQERLKSVLAGLLIQYPEVSKNLGIHGIIDLVKEELSKEQINYNADLDLELLLGT